MSDLSLPRTGYTNSRSPSALAAAILVNGGVFAALIALPAVEVIKRIDTRLIVREVKLSPLPPETRPEEKKRETTKTQKVIEQTPRQDTVVPPIVDTGAGFVTEKVEPLGPISDGIGTQPYVAPQPTPPSVFTGARLNKRFIADFKPDYPPGLRREGIEGSVTVRVTIDEKGRVTAVALVKATDPRFFEETRQQALRYWRFDPARRDGVAVVSEQIMTVHFRLEDETA